MRRLHIVKLLVVLVLAMIGVQCGGGIASEEGTSTSALEACAAEWSPTWLQRSANEWWVEYRITGATVASARLEIVETGRIVPLSYQWSKWVGP